MLSKQYLKYRRSGDYLKIVFKRIDDIAALDTSDMLLELFRTAEKECTECRIRQYGYKVCAGVGVAIVQAGQLAWRWIIAWRGFRHCAQ